MSPVCDNCCGPSEHLQARDGYMVCADCCDLADSPYAERIRRAGDPHDYVYLGGNAACFACGRERKDRVHVAAGEPSMQQMTTWPGLGGTA